MAWHDDHTEKARADFESASQFTVEVGATGPQGGDAGHGGFAEISFDGRGSTDWFIRVDDTEIDRPSRITIRVGGDSEAHNLVKALEFAALNLRQQWARGG